MTIREIGNAVVSAVLGVVLGVLAPKSVAEAVGSPERLALILLVLLVGALLIYTARIHGAVATPKPRIKVHSSSSIKRPEIYNAARNIVTSARKSIRALSYDTGNEMEIESPQKDSYFEGIEDLVASKRRAGAEFVYRRLFQLSTPLDEGVSVASVGERGFVHFSKLQPFTRDNAFSQTKVYLAKHQMELSFLWPLRSLMPAAAWFVR